MRDELDFNHCTVGEVSRLTVSDFVQSACLAMESRFSTFVVTPEQQDAWRIGFKWIHEFALALERDCPMWKLMPEYSAPLISGRPDLVIDTGSHLLVVEMKTGIKNQKTLGEKQVLNYADTLWGKLKLGRSRSVIPILLSNSHKKIVNLSALRQNDSVSPNQIMKVNPSGLIDIGKHISREFEKARKFDGENSEFLKYSPRPSVVDAAVALVAALDDKNIITGLADSEEISRVIAKIKQKALDASKYSKKEIIVVAGAPGAGKTLVGLRIAHDSSIQEILGEEHGTPLYLTGNGPLVEVLVESLARDQSLRTGITKSKSLSSASTKVRSIHGITEKNLGIESNIIVFDEGQRIWNESHMKRKKRSLDVRSEAEEVLMYLEKLPWALAVVLLGEGQEINSGEEGLSTWIKAIHSRNSARANTWNITTPSSQFCEVATDNCVVRDDELRLRTIQRTDNAANVSLWVEHFLSADFVKARELHDTFADFPFYFTRDLEIAKSWLKLKAIETSGRSGLVASSKSKRLLVYGVDAVADANRSFNWANWYLNDPPDLTSSGSLEVAATEYKCQGLELDFVGVCWSWDMVLQKNNWIPRSLNTSSARWSSTKSKSHFQTNAYRVLLTRCRKGMIVWIPRGDDSDSSRDKKEMDLVAHCFVESGITEIKVDREYL
jgi:hypothetical protein